MENGLYGNHPSPHLSNYVSLTTKPLPSPASTLLDHQPKMALIKSEGPEKTKDQAQAPLVLNSPGGGDPLQFGSWVDNSESVGLEIMDAIRLAIQHINELSQHMLMHNCRIADVDPKNYNQVSQFCVTFNDAALEYAQRNTPKMNYANKELLKAIVTRSYNKAVDNEKALNKHYEAFSSQTYGETSYERMQMILEEIQLKESDVFVDLGSGVGQLVAHVAGGSKVGRCVGIEIAQLPAKFASTLAKEFRRWMDWFGMKYCDFELEHSDFLHERFRELITQEATIIFINNYAFKSDLETRIIRELLVDLKHGTKIISTKPYVPVKSALRGSSREGSVSEREVQKDNFSVIVDITELNRCANPPCSWTSAYVPYYLQTINRTKLERYFENKKRGKWNGDNSRCSSTPSSKASACNSRESSVGLRENNHGEAPSGRILSNNCRASKKLKTSLPQRLDQSEEDLGYGPTTRRKWMEYVGELEQKRKRESDTQADDIDTFSENPTLSMPSKSNNNSSSFPVANMQNDAVALPLSAREFATPSSGGRSNHLSPLSRKSLSASSLSGTDAFSFNASQASSASLASPTSSFHPKAPMTPSAGESTAISGLLNLIRADNVASSDSVLGLADMDECSGSSLKARRQPKRSYGRKAVNKPPAPRGRPRKADRDSSARPPVPSKQPRLSDEAKEGIELMHQMTCALANGNEPMGAIDFLSDLKSPKKEPAQGLLCSLFPFPQMVGGPHQQQQQQQSILQRDFAEAKYPALEKFLAEMRAAYEDFLDSIAARGLPTTEFRLPSSYEDTHPSVKQYLPIKLGALVQQQQSGATQGHPTSSHSSADFGERTKHVLGRYQRVTLKSSELQAELTSLHAETEQLLRDMQQAVSSAPLQQQTNAQLLAAASLAAQPLSFPSIVQQQHSPSSIAQKNNASALDNLVLAELVNRYAQQQQQQQQQQLPLIAELLQQLGGVGASMVGMNGATLGNAGASAAISADANAPFSLSALQALMNINCEANLTDMSNRAMVSALSPSHASVASTLLQQGSGGLHQQSAVQNFLGLNNAASDLMSSIFNQPSSKASGPLISISNGGGHGGLGDGGVAASKPLPFSPPCSVSLNSSLAPMPMESVQNASITQVVAKSPNHQSTVAAVVAAVAAAGSSQAQQMPTTPTKASPKKTRSRVAKSVSSNAITVGDSKRSTQGVQQPAQDPEKAEEIERQIKNIVSLALEVDEAAKSAEKERKTRMGDKRGATNKDKQTGVYAANNAIPSSASSVVSPLLSPTHQPARLDAGVSIGAALKAAAGLTTGGQQQNGKGQNPLSNFIPTVAATSEEAVSPQTTQFNSFIASAASAAAQLLSTASSSSSRSTISITAVAPPPHSPLPDSVDSAPAVAGTNSAILANFSAADRADSGTSSSSSASPKSGVQHAVYESSSSVYIPLSRRTKLENPGPLTYPHKPTEAGEVKESDERVQREME